ncbi:hypothetical protein VTP01DRAFT_7367 [Rhizomucor pusillus]|uniref:uncharacterized protein n=1 Tax=Rhizomucor pusillus TaxID=4840 RepID=UPI0037423780
MDKAMLSTNTADLSPWTMSSTKSSTLETRSSYTQYLRNIPCESIHGLDTMQTEVAKKDVDILMREAYVKRAYTLYTEQDKVRLFKLMFEKVLSASAAAKQLGIHVQYVDENPSVVLEQLVEQLLQRFKGLKVSKSTVYDFVRTQCNLSLKKARFQPVDRNSEATIQEHLGWVRKWEGSDMDFRTNCVFLDESAFHVNMKRSRFLEKETLTTRINEACNRIILSDFEGFASPPNASAKRDFSFRKYSTPGNYASFPLAKFSRLLSFAK